MTTEPTDHNPLDPPARVQGPWRRPATDKGPADVLSPAPYDPAETIELLLVTGLSGAGKTAATAVLDDLGWFVVDNVPPSMLTQMIDTITARSEERRIAIGADIRGGVFFGELQDALDDLAKRGVRPHVMFLEASDEALVRRFESSRRPHPLQGAGRVVNAIEAEREQLAELRGDADLVIDTSLLNVHELAARIRTAFGQPSDRLRTIIVSFGYKYGLPVDADLVADMRFLPNPHWVPELRPQTGQDAQVRDYVLDQPRARDFLDRYAKLIAGVSDGYLTEGKRFLTVGVGCTGGKHRSVAMSEALAARLADDAIETLVVHRDLGRE
jgi:UPF0042 nucleotide-binding protein